MSLKISYPLRELVTPCQDCAWLGAPVPSLATRFGNDGRYRCLPCDAAWLQDIHLWDRPLKVVLA